VVHSDGDAKIVTSDTRAHVTHVWDAKSGRFMGLMPGVTFENLGSNGAVLTRFGEAVVAVSPPSDIADRKLIALGEGIRGATRVEESEIVLVFGYNTMSRVDVSTRQSAKVRLPDNASLPSEWRLKRHYLLNHGDRVELYDAQQDRVLGSRLLQRKSNKDKWTDAVTPIEPGSIAAAAVSFNADGAEEITIIGVADGRVLQAGPSEGKVVSVQDPSYRGEDGALPAGAFLLERRKGRLEPITASALRQAYCQRSHYNRDWILTWRIPDPDEAHGDPANAAESRRARAAALGYAVVGNDIVNTHVCDERGPLSFGYWRDLPERVRLSWGW
jgi:hypothetical protein